jgi:NitT/TauT family transport system substrate-binding protein
LSRRFPKRATRLALVVLALALVIAGAAATAGSAPRAKAAQAADHVTYGTGFGFFGRESPIYVAIDRGYFKDANIDVTVTGGTGSVGAMNLTAAGKLDFAIADSSAVILALAGDAPPPVRIIDMYAQYGLGAIFTVQGYGINTPKDLEGHTVADSPGVTTVLFPLFAQKAGFDASKVTRRTADPPALPALLASHQADAVGQFIVGIPTFEAATGKKIIAFPYAKYIPGLLGIGIIASDDTIKNKADLAKRFVAAFNKGLKYAIDNPGDAGRIINKYQPLTNPVTAAKEMKIMKFYAQNADTLKNGVGVINLQRLASSISLIRNGFKLTKPLAVSQIYAPGFTKVITGKKK